MRLSRAATKSSIELLASFVWATTALTDARIFLTRWSTSACNTRCCSSARLRAVSPRDLRCADDFACGIPERRSLTELFESAIPALPYGPIGINALTASDSIKNSDFLVMMIRWKECRDRPANHLGGGITGESLRPVVPGRDEAMQVFTHNGVVRRITIADNRWSVSSACLRSIKSPACRASTSKRRRSRPMVGEACATV